MGMVRSNAAGSAERQITPLVSYPVYMPSRSV